MLRAALDHGWTVDLLVLNQSENKTTSADIRKRLAERYPKARRITVRRHPQFIRKWQSAELLGRARYLARLAADHVTGRGNAINGAKHCPPNFARLIRSQLGGDAYSVAYFNYLRVMPRSLSTTSTVLCDLHDHQAERIKADVLPRMQAWRRRDYLRRFSNSEVSALNRCDLSIAISPPECKAMTASLKPRGPIVCIPATDDYQAIGSAGALYDLLYVGSRSDANVAGIVWFLEKCFPSIVYELPLVRLLIQGSIINAPYLKAGAGSLPNGANITLTGTVPSLASVYASARLVICPVLHGTGMKIKMVEAMAYGMPIVATSKAAEGIAQDLGLDTHDGPEGFAMACIEALGDDSAMSRLARASRATFARDHSPEVLRSRMAEVLDRCG